MYVNTSDALGFSKLKEDFGVPTPTREMVELFGQYCGSDHWCFWSHDPDTQVWARHEIVERTPVFEGIAGEERRPFLEAYKELADLPAPPLPADRLKTQRDRPFLYMGFTFQWLFIAELSRWELLPLGRHDTLTAQR